MIYRLTQVRSVLYDCQVVLSVRVREPLQHYLSAYIWATALKPSKGLSKVRTQAKVLKYTNGSRLSNNAQAKRSHDHFDDQLAWHADPPSPSFFAWSAIASNFQVGQSGHSPHWHSLHIRNNCLHNLQTRALLYGGMDSFVTSELYGRLPPNSKSNAIPPEASEADVARLAAVLEMNFDVVTPVCDMQSW